MRSLTYLLVKETIWDQFLNELREVFSMFSDFFAMIKEVTYDVAVKYMGTDITNIMIIAVGAIAIMLVCLSIINK